MRTNVFRSLVRVVNQGHLSQALCLGLLLVVCGRAQSQTLSLDNKVSAVEWQTFEYLPDPGDALTLEEVLSPAHAGAFKPHTADAQALEPGTHTYWIRSAVENKSAQVGSWVLGFQHWVDISYYLLGSDQQVIDQRRSGQYMPFSQRDPAHHSMDETLIKLHLGAGQTGMMYIRLHSNTDYAIYPVRLSGKVFSLAESGRRRSNMLNMLYFFSGIYLAIFVYNLFVWLSIHDRSYLYYQPC